jgi:hypothetical protein
VHMWAALRDLAGDHFAAPIFGSCGVSPHDLPGRIAVYWVNSTVPEARTRQPCPHGARHGHQSGGPPSVALNYRIEYAIYLNLLALTPSLPELGSVA